MTIIKKNKKKNNITKYKKSKKNTINYSDTDTTDEELDEIMKNKNYNSKSSSTISKNDVKESLPWVEKYRPTNLEYVVGQENILHTLKKCLKRKDFPHLLFYGPPGTGKTSTINAIVKELYGNNSNLMILELNVSDKRGIESVRKDILDFVSTKGYQLDIHKFVILDEADAMTDDAQNSLRNIIEKHTFNARFCLICNYLNKINPALISRCIKFYFFPLDKNNIKKRIDQIIKQEKIKVTDEGKDLLIKRSKGDMRNILNTLQSMSILNSDITMENVNDFIAYPKQKYIEKMFKWLKGDIKEAYENISNLKKQKGYSLIDIINALSEYIISNKIKNKEKIIPMLAKIELNLASNISDRIQLMAMCSILHL